MCDVKRFLVTVNDTCDMDSYQMVVLASDYAALEADRDRLKVIADNYYALLAYANADLAQLSEGQEPVAWTWQGALDQLKGYCPEGIAVFGHKGPGVPIPLYTAQLPSAVPVVHGLDADDVRAACKNAIEVFAEEENAEQCREVAEYMREVLLADLDRASPATVQADRWISVSERLPQIKQVLSEKCTLEGREIPTLYRSGMVLTFDGSRVSAGIVEWFHSKSPLNNVTHWMPLPAAPEVV